MTLGRLPVPRLEPAALVGAAALAGYALLAALSGRWSWSPAASRDDALTAACYLAAWIAGALLASLPRARRRAAWTVGGLAVLTCVAALVERAFTSPVQLNARLFGPIGHANGLAMLAILGLLVGAALVLAGSPRDRTAGGAVCAVTALTLLLTGSRSGTGLAVVALGVLLALTAPGLRGGLPAVGPALVGAAVGLWAGTWSTFSSAQSYAEVPEGGARLLAASVAVAAVGAALAARLPGEGTPGRDAGGVVDGRAAGLAAWAAGPRGRQAGVAAGAVLLLVVGAFAVRLGADGPAGDARAIDRTGSGRLTSLSSNNRDHWWGTAWSGFREHPLAGTGAGTFRLLEQVTRNPAVPAENAHNVVLAALAGTGLFGGVLMATAGGGLLLGAARTVLGPAREVDRPFAVALLTGAAAVFAQSFVEVDWDLEALGVLATGSLGTLAARPWPHVEAPDRHRLGSLAAILAAAWSVGFAVAAVPPWLADRAAADAELRILDDPQGALDRAAAARRLDRRSVRALMILGEAREAVGDTPAAKAAFEHAVRLEPRNYEPWLRAGTQQHLNWGDARGAIGTLARALELSGGNPTTAAALRDARNSPTLLTPPG